MLCIPTAAFCREMIYRRFSVEILWWGLLGSMMQSSSHTEDQVVKIRRYPTRRTLVTIIALILPV